MKVSGKMFVLGFIPCTGYRKSWMVDAAKNMAQEPMSS